ncbi:MAG: hypothetical protein JWR86_764, partial [Enterovirga sp.]|nr:hypothetical protein [Enterovirga sp.]
MRAVVLLSLLASVAALSGASAQGPATDPSAPAAGSPPAAGA